MDLTESIAPRSDQINADDLIADLEAGLERAVRA